eukprot:m.24725 g.24725  ORF g.24725 m.24725 type:complete len:58 (+) comp28674_c0_seq4:1337-1510(+)
MKEKKARLTWTTNVLVPITPVYVLDSLSSFIVFLFLKAAKFEKYFAFACNRKTISLL